MLWPEFLPRILWLHRRCPKCASTRFSTGGRLLRERLLHVVGMRQVRCAGCSRQYYWFISRVGWDESRPAR